MSFVPSSHAFIDGPAVSSEMNAYVRDPIYFALNRPRAELRQNGTQPIGTGVDVPIVWNFQVVDTGPDGVGGLDVSGDLTRWYAQYTGLYQVDAFVMLVANATGSRQMWMEINGADVDRSADQVPGSTVPATLKRSRKVFMNQADYLQIFVRQDSGSSLDTVSSGRFGSSLGIVWVSN